MSIGEILPVAMEPPQNDEGGAASIERMQQAWINETNAPEILPYEDDLVKNLTAVIDIRVHKPAISF